MTGLAVVASARASLGELRRVVAEAKGGDPLVPVTVLVPTNLAGLVARRFLAAGLGKGNPGVAAVHPTTIGRLAEQLAAPVVCPRRPATSPVVTAAWRAALHAEPGVFAEVAAHPATVQGLVRTYRELRDLNDAALDAVADVPPLGADLVRLHRAVQGRLSPGWYDQTDLLHAATGVCSPKRCAELGTVVLYLPQALTRAESGFVAALAMVAPLRTVLGLSGQPRADAAVHRTLHRLHLAVPAAPPIPMATRVLTASDADDEVRCVVREVVSALRSTPAHRVALLHTAAAPYARLLHEHLHAAGVTVNGPGTRPVHERAIARAVLELLDLAEHDVPRGDLFRVLAAAPLRTSEGTLVPVSRWERLSRSAGVVAGEHWDIRLSRYAEDERARLVVEEQREDPRPGVCDRLRASIEDAEGLRRFATGLLAAFTDAKGLHTWAELSSWALALVQSAFGDSAALVRLPPEEQYAAVAVQQALSGLAVLDELGAPPSLPALRETVATQLENALPRVGRFGDGVLVAPVSAAVGLDVDLVVVLGLAEAVFPGRLREDPLLPERAREASDGQLVEHRERLDTQHRYLLAAFGAAPDVLATFPRGDLRTRGQHLPSRWLLPTLRALSGRPTLAATAWDSPPTGWMSTSPSFAGSLSTAAFPAHEQEWRTQAAYAGHPLADAVVDSAHSLLQGRRDGTLSRYDGDLSAVATGLPDFAAGQQPVSPTALEAYARCPHAYFVQRLLRVEPVEQPEDVITISPADVGTLMHASFDALVRECGPDLPGYGQPWTEHQRRRLAELAAHLAVQLSADGRTGHPRLWAQALTRIQIDLQGMLTDDDGWRQEKQAAVIASELAFGMRGAPAVSIALPGGGSLLMRGAADKVDRDADGRLYVTDIKSGSARAFADLSEADPVLGGSKLQLPVYAHAARMVHGPGAEVEAAYWFVRRDKGRIPVPLTAAVEARYAATLQLLVSSIRDGLFPQRPPTDPDFAWVQCPYCNPDGIGHAEARRRWEHVKTDPRLSALVALIEPVTDAPTTTDPAGGAP